MNSERSFKYRLPHAAHLIGIGGVGMAGLALILDDMGVAVSGSDTAASANTRLLAGRGMPVAIGHAAGNLPAPPPELVVYSSAIPPRNPELRAATTAGCRVVRRGDYLAELAMLFPQRIAVAGSHGKTTVAAMIAHTLLETGHDIGYLVGAAVTGRDVPAAAGDGRTLIFEVDESDGTQARVHSSLAVVVSVDDDHCWSVGGVPALQRNFRTFAANAAALLTLDMPALRTLFAAHPDVTFLPPSQAAAITDLHVPGRHNRLNALLAREAAIRTGVERATATATLRTFAGVERRLSLRCRTPRFVVVEDYAHHPAELRVGLDALRERYPTRRLCAIFQPHRAERVKRYADAFAAELSRADAVWVVPTFNAWVDDADPADPRAIVRRIAAVPARFAPEPYEQLAAELADAATDGDVFAVFGAGDVTRLTPLLTARLRRQLPTPDDAPAGPPSSATTG